jgi:MYXO-CTERM domain-containing protein
MLGMVCAACGQSPLEGPAGVRPTPLVVPNERAQLQARYVAARQQEAAGDDRYHVAARTRLPLADAEGPGLTAMNPAQGLELSFRAAGARVAPREGRWELGLTATELTCGTTVHRLPRTEPASPVAPNRIDFQSSVSGVPVTEWYVNGPLGLEQGFTIGASPCASERTTLGVVIELTGLSPLLATGGEAGPAGEIVELRDSAGSLVARYGGLLAMDAAGRALASRLAVAGARLQLEVDLAGAAWPVTIDPLLWVMQKKLLASDAQPGDFLGTSVALSGNTAVVGATFDDDNGESSGAAYVFVRSGADWTEQQKLKPSDGVAGDRFGWPVAISGNTVLVGCYLDNPQGAESGSAYVFVRSGSTWTQQQKLTAADGAAQTWFGYSVALDGDTALVSRHGDAAIRGSAYVFVRSGSTWTQQQKLTAADGLAGDYFGGSVALSDNTALVGAYVDDNQPDDRQGSAYVFVRSGTTWTEQQKLLPSDGSAEDWFGWSVALWGDTALVGAFRDDPNGFDSGSVYAFTRSGTTWTEGQKLSASDGATTDYFGHQVALSADKAVVAAAPDFANTQDTGAAYVFVRSGNAWTEQQKLVTSEGVTNDEFGASVAISGTTVLVGAQRDGDTALAAGTGTAFVFSFGLEHGDACSLDSDCASLRCIEGLCRDIPRGEACSPGDVCETGHCQDGVCCSSACQGICQACTNALTGEPDGTCAPIPADEDPDGDCEMDATFPESCGADGLCNGQGLCRAYAKASTPCGATTCAAGVESSAVCDGVGQCDTTSRSCAPFVCAADACGSTQENGTECVDGTECVSGHCTDGVCCESACQGQCEACAEAGSEGECVVVTGAPRGDRSACSGEPDVCGGECDGMNEMKCSYAPVTRVCGSACEAGRQTLSSCDGAGECVAAEPEVCGGYACAAAACHTSCDSDAACAEGFVCFEQACLPRGPRCAEGDGNNCEPTPSDSGIESGCGCRVPGGSTAPSWPLPALVGLGALLLGRRRPRTASLDEPRDIREGAEGRR